MALLFLPAGARVGVAAQLLSSVWVLPHFPGHRTKAWIRHVYNYSPKHIWGPHREQQAVIECLRRNCNGMRDRAIVVPWGLFNNAHLPS